MSCPIAICEVKPHVVTKNEVGVSERLNFFGKNSNFSLIEKN